MFADDGVDGGLTQESVVEAQGGPPVGIRGQDDARIGTSLDWGAPPACQSAVVKLLPLYTVLALALALGGPALAEPSPFAELERSIEAGERGKIVALVVEQHGQIVYEHRFRTGSARRPRVGRDPALHDIRSAGKSITALAVGAALADGQLSSLDQPVWPLLGRDDPEHGSILVRDLLSMSSALDCDDGDPKSPGNEERMYMRRVWRTFALDIPVDPAAPEVGRFSYCTAGVFLLGQVLEAVTGERFDAYVQRRLFEPLGIEGVVWNHSRSGEIQSGGQLEIGAADLSKLGRLVLGGGRWKGQQIVPEAWIEQMLSPHHKLGGPVACGYLWWFRPVPSPRGWESSWSMQGNGGNLVAIFREVDAVITVQSANYNKPGAHDRSFEIVAAALKALPAPP